MKKPFDNNPIIANQFPNLKFPKFKSHFYAGAAGAALAFAIVCILIAFPSSYLSGQEGQVTNQSYKQRNNLDSALKQLISVRKSEPQTLIFHEEVPLPANNKLASLGASKTEMHNDFEQVPIFSGTIQASFPYVYPVMGPRKSSGFGLRVHPIRRFSTKHKGIDLAAPVGASIRAMAKGRVIFADPYAGYGNLIVLDHGNGITTHYAHCDRLVVHIGETVETGQVIAAVGSTGMSTGPHLHLEARINGQPINPEVYFTGLADKAEG